MKNLIFTLLLCSFFGSLHAQTTVDKIMAETGFYNELLKLRDDATQKAIFLKTAEAHISSDEYEKIKIGYETCRHSIETVLNDIQKDLMNKKKRRVINQFPEMYMDGMQAKMTRINTLYQTQFLIPLNDAYHGDIDMAVPMLTLLPALIESTGQLVRALRMIHFEVKQLRSDRLHTVMVSPYLFPTWDEI